jgi:MFS family permease
MEEIYLKKEQTFTNFFNKNHIIYLSFVFCFWFSIYIYIPNFSIYLDSILHFSYSEVGIILGSYGITQILLRLPLGLYTDFYDGIQNKLLLLGLIFAFISGLLLVFFQSFIPIFIARLFAGITASIWVIITVLYSQQFFRNAASSMGIMQFLTVFTQFISMLLSDILIIKFGWLTPFWLAIFVSFIGIILANFIQINKSNIDNKKTGISINCNFLKSHIKKILTIKGFLLVSFLSLCAHAIFFITIFGFSTIYLLNFEHGSIIILICAFFIPHSLASVFVAMFKISLKRNRMLILISFFVTLLVLVFIPLYSNAFYYYFFHIILGLCLGFIFPLTLAQVIEKSPKEQSNYLMGFFQSFYAIGIVLGPLLAGFFAKHFELNSIFYFTGGIAIVAIILSLKDCLTTNEQDEVYNKLNKDNTI